MFYKPVLDKRYFHSGELYSTIDWRDFRAVVAAFTAKINGWYLEPGRLLRPNWDHAFTLMTIDCLLIDSLSQYYYGALTSKQRTFKQFARKSFPAFRRRLPQIILAPAPRREKRKRKPGKPLSRRPRKQPHRLETFSDVLYVGFRCGILHEAHVMLCGGMAGLPDLCDIDTDICTLYRNGTPCPTVRMDPGRIFDAIETVFLEYVSDLVDPAPAHDVRRKHFKKKFRSSFGIDLESSSL